MHNRIHSGEKPYKCHMCDKAFGNSGHLYRHMRVHTGDKPYKCSLCNRSFSRISHLQRHKRHVHSNRKPYECPYCGKLSKTSADLKRHVRIHTGAKPYSCRHCSDRFTWLDQLKTHLLSHTMKVLGCRVTFVRSNLATVATLSYIYVVIKLWSPMFALNVQCVSVQQLNWEVIICHTHMSNTFVVVRVVNISNVNVTLWSTLIDVLLTVNRDTHTPFWLDKILTLMFGSQTESHMLLFLAIFSRKLV